MDDASPALAIRRLFPTLLSCLLAPLAMAQAQTDSQAIVGADWEGYNRTLDGQRYSPLSEINPSNAANLTETCRVSVASRGSLQAGPVVIEDFMYVTTPTETFAIDPVSCAVRWQHTYRRSQEPGLSVNRGVAYLNGRVFRGTDDGRLLALDAATGREIWRNVVGDASIGEYVASAPVAWNGLVLMGTSGGEFGIRGRILAYDALTGKELWRFNTIPIGKEAGAETWGDSKWATHGGGGTWSTFTVDPVTGELFVPIGNPVPDFASMDRRGANLFTNSVLVLDARTGELKWWYQLQANDDHDHDLGAAPILFRNGRNENMLAAAGKDGLLHIVERASHKLRFQVPRDDCRREAPNRYARGNTRLPGRRRRRAVEWTVVRSQAGMTLFVGSTDLCMILKSESGTSYTPRGLNFGGGVIPSKETATGWVTAVDANSGAVRWKYHSDSPVLGGVTATAGGIVMTGDNNGNFLVFDSESGKLLRKEPTGGAIAGGVVTYWRGGKQYVALTSGNASPAATGTTGRPSIVVMSLPTKPADGTADSAAVDGARGHQLYVQICEGCHGLEGNRITGKDLRSVKSRMNAEQLAAFIRNPTRAMPKIFPESRSADDERDIRDLAAFLSTWKP